MESYSNLSSLTKLESTMLLNNGTTIANNDTTTVSNGTTIVNNGPMMNCHLMFHQEHHFPYPLATVLLLLIATVALIGNSLVVLVISKIRRMHTFMNWMLFNLALADLSASLFCITVDVTQEIIFSRWVFGKVLCHLLFPMRSVAIFTSIFTLMCLGISRYWAIMYPFRCQPSVKFAKILICGIWAFSFTLALPYMLGLRFHAKAEQCYEVWSPSSRKLYTVLTSIFTYVIPVTVITTAYSQIVGETTSKTRRTSVGASLACMNKDRQRENRKLIKLSMIISGTFSFCVLPYQIVWILYEFNDSFKCFKYLPDTIMASTLLLYLGSALNPITYNIFSESFREGFRDLCTNIASCCGRGHRNRLQASFTSEATDELSKVTCRQISLQDNI